MPISFNVKPCPLLSVLNRVHASEANSDENQVTRITTTTESKVFREAVRWCHPLECTVASRCLRSFVLCGKFMLEKRLWKIDLIV